MCFEMQKQKEDHNVTVGHEIQLFYIYKYTHIYIKCFKWLYEKTTIVCYYQSIYENNVLSRNTNVDLRYFVSNNS